MKQKALTSLMGFFALAPNKKKYHPGTIRPIEEMAMFRFGFVKNKMALEFTVFYSHKWFSEITPVRYIAFLDENKVARRFMKIQEPKEVGPHDTFTVDGVIHEA